jgi:protein-tyrosine-phosphatase
MAATILFVCAGNMCRSPMAEGMLKAMLRTSSQEAHYRVRSAGTWTQDGLHASPLAIEAMQEMGIHIADHRTHHLTARDVAAASLVIVMTRGHSEALRAEFPEARHKIVLLSELVGETHDVSDPYGSDSLEPYRQCAREIDRLLRAGYPRLLELGKQKASEGQATKSAPL